MTQAEVDAYNLRHRQPSQIQSSTEDNVTPESEIQDQIEAECKRRGWYVVRSRMDRPTTNGIGTPDLIIAADRGLTYWVEVKRPGRKLTPEQLAANAWLLRDGHRAAVVHSLEEFIRYIQGEVA